MKKIMSRAKNALRGEHGSPLVATVVLIIVVMVVAVALFAFGDDISALISGTGNALGDIADDAGIVTAAH